jgi:nucleoside-diphosphate-sugar epimerase
MTGHSALIGHTGFVGGALSLQHSFDELYSSKNIRDSHGKYFDFVVCAGAPGLKWKANHDPKEDFKKIFNLVNSLKEIRAGKFVLISTIDVFDNPVGAYEHSKISLIKDDSYGMNRAYLEVMAASMFSDLLIVRLPTIYSNTIRGKGLMYDIRDGNYKYIPRRGQVQVYNIDVLLRDIRTAIENDIKYLNIATEPINIEYICRMGDKDVKPEYDMRSRHAFLWGRKGDYLYEESEVIGGIKHFLEA